MTPSPTLIIYRDELLGTSETFIRAQAESLRSFSPFFLGLRRIPGQTLPRESLHIISGSGLIGKLQRARFKVAGPGASLLRRLKRLQPALIHAHFGPDACNALEVADALRIPLLATFHGYDATVADEHLPDRYLMRRQRLKDRGSCFLCVSEYIRNRLLEKGFAADRLQVHYTGIDTDFFRPDPDLPRSPIVLFVGRLVEVKGCQFVIRAMSRIQPIMPEAKLVVIGDGPLRRQLTEQALVCLRNFEFRGVQTPSMVRDCMNRAAVLCTPSVTAASGAVEGFGMVFAEAQAMGLPVVSFASGGVPEAVAHGETGLLVQERDCEALAASLLVLLRTPQLWTRFSQAGRRRVLNSFDIHRQAKRLEAIYNHVLSEFQRQSARPEKPLSTMYREQNACLVHHSSALSSLRGIVPS